MTQNIFRGLGIALVTPFKTDGSVDYEALARLVDYQLDNGADFLCILATTGETPCLTKEEKGRIKKQIVEQAKADGFVSTLYHRRRALPELKSSNFAQRSFGERVALNMPIQGTAADVIKLAMVHVAQRLEREKLAAKLILQVHDELIVECPEAETERVKALLTEEMERVASLSVPLIAEANAGKNWADAH